MTSKRGNSKDKATAVLRILYVTIGVSVLFAIFYLTVVRSASFNSPSDRNFSYISESTVALLPDEYQSIEFSRQPVFGPDSDEAIFVQKCLREPPVFPRNGPAIVHILHIYGLGNIPFDDLPSGKHAVGKLIDVGEMDANEEPLFYPTRHGIRYHLYTRKNDGESHRDLFLATFARLGLPLSTEFKHVRDQRFELKDLLRDSISQFHLNQTELAWTAIAYALILPPISGWENRDGERFDFDMVVNELISRPLNKASCAGTHIIESLLIILNVDAIEPVLKPPTRLQLRRYLEGIFNNAERNLAPEGYWGLNWYTDNPSRSGADDEILKLVVTGHLLEICFLLPSDLQPSIATYRRAGGWLLNEIQKMPPELTNSTLCPWTHAFRALELGCEAPALSPRGTQIGGLMK